MCYNLLCTLLLLNTVFIIIDEAVVSIAHNSFFMLSWLLLSTVWSTNHMLQFSKCSVEYPLMNTIPFLLVSKVGKYL